MVDTLSERMELCMDSKTKARIIDELNQRIDDEQGKLEIEAVRALEEFREWFFENFIY